MTEALALEPEDLKELEDLDLSGLDDVDLSELTGETSGDDAGDAPPADPHPKLDAPESPSERG